MHILFGGAEPNGGETGDGLGGVGSVGKGVMGGLVPGVGRTIPGVGVNVLFVPASTVMAAVAKAIDSSFIIFI